MRKISPIDPEHLPAERMLIESFQHQFPELPQIACFDTAFHHNMLRVAQLLPIPRRYDAQGVRLYGFHGLSYAYLVEELERLGNPAATKGRVIFAHLGSGTSLAAVRDGKCIDTSMSFTPTSELPMGTRSGDLDPGLVWFLARTESMSTSQFNEMVNTKCGLLGVSETSSDVRDLLEVEADDVRAAEALARICESLDFLGLKLDQSRNSANAEVISGNLDGVTVRVIHTDESQMIARSVCRVLELPVNEDNSAHSKRKSNAYQADH